MVHILLRKILLSLYLGIKIIVYTFVICVLILDIYLYVNRERIFGNKGFGAWEVSPEKSYRMSGSLDSDYWWKSMKSIDDSLENNFRKRKLNE